MWIRYTQDGDGYKNGQIVGIDDVNIVADLVNTEQAIRVLNPDGKLFEDSAPEEIIALLAEVDGISFLEEEEKIRTQLDGLPDFLKQKFMLGQFVP